MIPFKHHQSFLETLESTESIPLEVTLNLLQIPPSSRRVKDINMLRLLTRDVKFFKDQSENSDLIHFESCQSMKYEFCANKQVRPTQIVFNFGEVGLKFFIIINGKVEVLIPISPNQMIQVAILSDGKSFGDLALLKDAPRNATISCLTDCHFAVLNKSDYLRILGKIEVQKINLFVDLLREIPVFKSWGRRNIDNLYHFFKNLKFSRNNIVFAPNEQASHCFIVKAGEFELSKKVKITGKKGRFNLKVAILTRGEMFGEDDILLGRNREMTCRCYSTNGELLAITAKDFLLKVRTDESIGIINSNQMQKRIMREVKDKDFQRILDLKFDSQCIDFAERIRDDLKVRRKVLYSDLKKKGKTKQLELTEKDIRGIRERAFGKSADRMFIVLNRPAQFSLRTPSPCLRNKYRKRNQSEANETCFDY